MERRHSRQESGIIKPVWEDNYFKFLKKITDINAPNWLARTYQQEISYHGILALIQPHESEDWTSFQTFNLVDQVAKPWLIINLETQRLLVNSEKIHEDIISNYRSWYQAEYNIQNNKAGFGNLHVKRMTLEEKRNLFLSPNGLINIAWAMSHMDHTFDRSVMEIIIQLGRLQVTLINFTYDVRDPDWVAEFSQVPPARRAKRRKADVDLVEATIVDKVTILSS